jgi:hypothetical protein
MSGVYFTPRPANVFFGIQWVGDNLTEVEDFLTTNMPWLLPVADLGAGVCSAANGNWTIQDGDWITSMGPVSGAVVESDMQVLTGEPPFGWTITGS